MPNRRRFRSRSPIPAPISRRLSQLRGKETNSDPAPYHGGREIATNESGSSPPISPEDIAAGTYVAELLAIVLLVLWTTSAIGNS